jgi:hypothetical protein
MKYYVVLSDGRKFGPADIDTLNAWIKEGRVTRDTMMENEENGLRARASEVQGLKFELPKPDLGGEDPMIKKDPNAVQRPQTTYQIPGQPAPYIAGQPQATPGQTSPYENPPAPGSPYPRTYNPHLDDGSQKLINTAWICIAVGFVCCFLVTPFGIYNANRAKLMGNPNAQTPFIVGWILFGLQLVGVLIYAAIFIMAIASGGAPPT